MRIDCRPSSAKGCHMHTAYVNKVVGLVAMYTAQDASCSPTHELCCCRLALAPQCRMELYKQLTEFGMHSLLPGRWQPCQLGEVNTQLHGMPADCTLKQEQLLCLQLKIWSDFRNASQAEVSGTYSNLPAPITGCSTHSCIHSALTTASRSMPVLICCSGITKP